MLETYQKRWSLQNKFSPVWHDANELPKVPDEQTDCFVRYGKHWYIRDITQRQVKGPFRSLEHAIRAWYGWSGE